MKSELHSSGITAPQGLREHLDRRLLFALSRFESRISKVDVYLADENGPKGGLDKACRIVVRLRKLGDVTASIADSDWFVAIDRATTRIAHNLRREVERKRHLLSDTAMDDSPASTTVTPSAL